MDFDEYSSAALRTHNPSLSWEELVLHGTLGIVGEGGEVADILKKYFFQGHVLEVQDIAKELGDVLWSLNLVADCFGFSLQEIAEGNIEKLRNRYPQGFEEERSVNRA